VKGVKEGSVTLARFGGKTARGDVYDVSDVNFGGVLGQNAEIVVPDPVEFPPSAQYDGILGRDLLSRVALTIDYADNCIYVQAP
jgi:hypothetical protein